MKYRKVFMPEMNFMPGALSGTKGMYQKGVYKIALRS